MKKIIITVFIGLIVGAVGVSLFGGEDNKGLGGIFGRGFFQTATSGPMTITSNDQLLATSSARGLAIICNPTSTLVYLNLDQDKSASLTQATTVIIAGAAGYNACYEVKPDNAGEIYWGAINASSTNETSVTLLISEYKNR